jgi:hypothetical protein
MKKYALTSEDLMKLPKHFTINPINFFADKLKAAGFDLKKDVIHYYDQLEMTIVFTQEEEKE